MHISSTTIKVRYAETDQMGVVYHANYLVWMEVGRTALIEDLGFHYAEMEEQGILAPVVDIHIQYIKPITYGGTATVETWIEGYDGLRVVYGYRITNEQGDTAVTATSEHVCVRKETFKPVSIRRLFPDWHQAYEKEKKKGE